MRQDSAICRWQVCVLPEVGCYSLIRIRLEEVYYDNSIYYGRNYTAADASGVPFKNDLEHVAEMVDRLWSMCHWKEKLEVVDSKDRWIRPDKDEDMMIPLSPEQEFLPEERERIEKDRQESGRYIGYEAKEGLIDDAIYKALKVAILDKRPVCIRKEGTEPGEGYPKVKIRNTSMENLV